MKASLFFSNEFLFMTKFVLEEDETIFTVTLDWIDLSTEVFSDSSQGISAVKIPIILDDFACIPSRIKCIKKIKTIFLFK
jgi:hypothetical protein